MKNIENKNTVGAPGSLARYQNAHRICADCLDKARYVLGQTQQPCGDWIPAAAPYKALAIGNGFASYDGICYVCEKRAHVAVVEFNAPVAFNCPRGYGECEDARACVYPGRCGARDADRDGAMSMCAELGID